MKIKILTQKSNIEIFDKYLNIGVRKIIQHVEYVKLFI